MSFYALRRRLVPSSKIIGRCFSSSAPTSRLRRSVHFVPGDNDKFLSTCLSVGADTIILDLEDSVKNKQVGREKVRAFLEKTSKTPERAHTEVLVRINPLSSSDGCWREDVDVGFFGADGFMVPKVESRGQLEELDKVLSGIEKGGTIDSGSLPKVLLPIATETPTAVLNIAEIASGPRVCAITWGCEDLSAELGSVGTRDSKTGQYLGVFQHCRQMCLLAARAAGVQAIDGIFQDVRDSAGFELEAREASFAGFDGKLTLHPAQVTALHRVFAPTTEELHDASAIVALWDQQDGKLEHRGKMIDLPHYVRAKKILARGQQSSGGSTNSSYRYMEKAAASGGVTQSPVPPTDFANSSTSSSSITDDTSVFPRVNMGKFFEELEPGLRFRHFLTRTVTEADNVFFTCLSMNPAPIHLDHTLAGDAGGTLSDNGKPLFNSMFTLALLVGMSVPETTHGTTVANLGFSDIVFPKPVYPGDTLRAETMVLDRRESKSRPTQGIVTLQHTAFNQRGEIICRATRQALMKKKY